jgi:hypothetical protein
MSLFDVFLDLSAVFSDLSSGDALFQIVRYFGDLLLPFADQIVDKFLEMCRQNLESGSDHAAILNLQSIDLLLRFVNDGTFQKLVVFMETIRDDSFLSEWYLPLVMNFLKIAEFQRDFWGILELYDPKFRVEFGRIINILCYRDEQLFDSPEIIANLIGLVTEEFDDSTFPIVEGLAMRAPKGHPDVLALLPAALAHGSAQLAGCLAVWDAETVVTSVGDGLPGLVQLLLDEPCDNVSPVAAIRMFDFLGDELKDVAVSHVVQFLEDRWRADEEDYEEDGHVQWFTVDQVCQEIATFAVRHELVDGDGKSRDDILEHLMAL